MLFKVMYCLRINLITTHFGSWSWQCIQAYTDVRPEDSHALLEPLRCSTVLFKHYALFSSGVLSSQWSDISLPADVYRALCAQYLIRHPYIKDQNCGSLHREVVMVSDRQYCKR